ncbi:MAG: ComEA family DNA-binding protein, partial [Flavisolibacter sp.]
MVTFTMPLKNLIREYLYFSKRDRIGILTILIIIMLVYFLPEFFPSKDNSFEVKQGSVLSMAIDSLEIREKRADEDHFQNNDKKNTPSGITPTLFQFDPNTLDAAGWKKLGLTERAITTIIHYRTKGGHFYKPEDLQKIWGLPADFYNRVKDYITLPERKKNFADTVHNTRSILQRKPSIVSINEADTSAFIALPGIGSKLAERIILFREKLGGFYSVDQISEI